MIVEIETGREARLLERDDFSALAVRAGPATPTAAVAAALGGREAEEDHVWIPAEGLRALAAPADDDWETSFRAMLAKVEPFGWYDAGSGHVKAHVERPR